jgi:probable phosphoglycerate mutase
MTATSQRLRCPCCGEIFNLADALPVDEEPAPANQSSIPTTVLPIKLVFDGGSIGNPGRGYGSYQLTVRGKAEAPKRLEFGDQYTNNEAEYDTLMQALEALVRRAKDPRRVQLDIRGDSQLVINQLNGVWKAKDPRMRERLERVRALLEQFGSWTATWHARAKSVKALGH